MPKIGIMKNMHNIVEHMENDMEWIENTEQNMLLQDILVNPQV